MPSAELTVDQSRVVKSGLPRTRQKIQKKKQPRYHVILWNDDAHTYGYVIGMLRKLFGYPAQQGLSLADEVHHRGRAIILTTTKEHAELKRDQITGFGRDWNVAVSQGAMSASIESEASGS